MGKRLTNVQVRELAGSLRALLAALDAGQVEADGATRARIEGAVVALDVTLGVTVDLIAHVQRGPVAAAGDSASR